MRKVPVNLNHMDNIEHSSKDKNSILKKLATTVLQVFCQFLLYFILITGILKMLLKDLTSQAMLKTYGPMCNCLIVIVKYIILAIRGKSIQHCVEHMQFDWRNIRLCNNRNIMMDYAQFGRSLAGISKIFVFASGFSYRAIVPLIKGTVVVQNVIIRPMPFPGFYLFFDVQISPAYEIVFTLQNMCAYVVYTCILLSQYSEPET